MKSHEKLLQSASALSLLIMIIACTGASGQARETLDPMLVPRFENSMPVIQDAGLRVDLTRGGRINVEIVETEQDLLGLGTMTKVWGYKFPGLPPSYPGATIVTKKDTRVVVRWENNLPVEYDDFPDKHLLPVDQSIHLARPMMRTGVPTSTHLHGGHSESASDGLPEAWFTRNFRETGKDFVKRDLRYDNTQEAATLWYHDHALGITRLNVYAGLAGFYLLRDENENKLIDEDIIPSGKYEVEVVIQDRMFDAETHQLYFPALPGDHSYEEFIFEEGATPPEGPSVLAEFFGDIILVNGKAWPTLTVEPRKYRIRLLNGSDSRFFVLSLKDEIPWFQIGTDNGFLAAATDIPDAVHAATGNELIIGPGERMDLVIDFSEQLGNEFVLWNYGPDEPFGGEFDLDLTRPTAQILKFVVSKPLDTSKQDASVQVGTQLRSQVIPSVPSNYVSAQQNLVLFEGVDEYGRLKPMLGTVAMGSLTWDDPVTENPRLNETQVWEVFNATMDAHPIHLHLVSFQILGRGTFTGEAIPHEDDTEETMMMGESPRVTFKLVSRDSWRPAEENELGWKDTHIVYPGEFSQIRAKFDRPGLYAWHCHILSHEDHEMMRPFYVGTLPVRKMQQIGHTTVAAYPNPLTTSTKFEFGIIEEQNVHLTVQDSYGIKRYEYSSRFSPGQHVLLWDARDTNGNRLPNGVYYFKLVGENFNTTDRVVIKN